MKDHTKGKEATEADAIVMPVAAFDLCPGTNRRPPRTRRRNAPATSVAFDA